MGSKSFFSAVLLAIVALNRGLLAQEVNLKRDGAFGFPQAQAQVLCDSETLRVAAWSNTEYLYVQAIVWKDSGNELVDVGGRKFGDYSQLVLDVEGDRQTTPFIDRTYSVGAFPGLFGLRYQVATSERSWTAVQSDSQGRGSIDYLPGGNGQRIRVDSFLVPLTEIGRQSGEAIRIAYFARSRSPELSLNSIGYESVSAYTSSSLPQDKFHAIQLLDGNLVGGAAWDPKVVPDGREQASPEPAESRESAPSLTIGSRAPALDIEHWVQNGNGQFQPVTAFVPGKVYIVEFWATWCGPCIAAMPHIADLQKSYADQGLQVVSISDEKREVVEAFLKRTVPGNKDQQPTTYGELTSCYCLTTDPDRSNHDNYMKAAGQNGIPTAFIVGKEGMIEWIGHPMRIDRALADVIKGQWDRAAFLAEYEESREFTRRSTSIMNMAYSGRIEAAKKSLAEARGAAVSDTVKARADILARSVGRLEVQRLILLNSKDAAPKLEALLEGQGPDLVNDVVWDHVVTVAEKGRKINPEILVAALRQMEKAVNQAPEDANLLDTQAHLLHLNGQLDRAIEVQTKAVKLSGDESRKSLTEYLEKLQVLKDPSNVAGSKSDSTAQADPGNMREGQPTSNPPATSSTANSSFVGLPTTMVSLLNLPEVQAELKISDDIKAKLASLTTEQRQLFEPLRNEFPGRSENSIRMTPESALRLREVMKTRIAKEMSVWRVIHPLLSPQQLERLIGLAIQRYESRSLVLEPVAELVGLNPDQTKIVEQARLKLAEARDAIPSLEGDFRNAVAKGAELRADATKLLDSMMDDRLKSRMEQLKGAKFEFPASSGPQGGFGTRAGGGFGPPSSTRSGISLAGPLAAIVVMPQVSKELGLSDTTHQKIIEIVQGKFTELSTAMRSIPLPARRPGAELTVQERTDWTELVAKFSTARNEIEKELQELLSKDQFDRLIGLLWQREGMAALFLSSAAGDPISLSADQRAQIEQMRSQLTASPNIPALFARTVPASDDIARILTDEQKARIESLKGKKFDFPPSSPLVSPAVEARNRATGLASNGDFANAIKAYDEAIQLSPTAVAYVLDRGIAKRRMDDLPGALADFNLAVEKTADANSFGPYHARAQLYMMLGETTKALEDFEDMSRKPSASAFSLYGRALALAEAGQPEKAQLAFQDVLNKDSRYESLSNYVDKPLFTRKETNNVRTISGWCCSWSPDGKQLVRGRTYFRLTEALEIVNLESGDVRLLCENGKDPAWSPVPGGPIAFVRGENLREEIWIINTDGSGLKKVADGGFPNWSADGRLFYRSGTMARGRNALRLDAIRIDQPETVLSSTPLLGRYPAVSPDGRLVATQGRDEDGKGRLVVKRVDGDEVVATVDRPVNDTVLPAFSPDGRYVCFGTSFSNYYPGLWLLDTTSGKVVLVSGEQLTMPRWSPDGKQLAVDDRSRSKILLFNIDPAAIRARTAGDGS